MEKKKKKKEEEKNGVRELSLDIIGVELRGHARKSSDRFLFTGAACHGQVRTCDR